MRWLAGAVFTAAMVSVAAFALAQEPPSNVELAWSAPAECPGRASVEREIRANLAGSTVAGNAVVARASVARAGDKWHVDLAIRSGQGSGERSFDAASCAELASAVALIVALTVDPSRRPAEPDAAPPVVADAGPPAPAPATPPAPAPPPTADSSEDPPKLAIGGEALADVGALPSASVGGGLTLALLLGRVRIEARGRLFVSQRALDTAQPTQGVDLSLVGGGGRGCFAILAGELTLAPCAGLAIERVAAAGFGGATGTAAFSRDTTWASGSGGLLATWAPLRWFALRLDAEILVPFSRPSFVVLAPDGSVAGVLHRPSPLGGRLGLGVEFRFF